LRMRTALMDINPSGTYSVDFDGSTGHVALGSTLIIANNTNTVSIFADISPDTGKAQSIISNRKVDVPSGVGFEMNANNTLSFRFYPTDGGAEQVVTDSRAVSTGVFSTVGVIFNGTHATFCINRSCVVDDHVITSKNIKSSNVDFF